MHRSLWGHVPFVDIVGMSCPGALMWTLAFRQCPRGSANLQGLTHHGTLVLCTDHSVLLYSVRHGKLLCTELSCLSRQLADLGTPTRDP